MKNFILILCLATFSQWVYAQNKQITGRVVDTKGEAAIGASILEKGTTNGTITDFDGNFKLTVGPKAVLQISYIGYKTQEIPVANKTKLNITMEEDTEVLDEVVVVGYGAQKKESVVGAISQVSSKELLKSPAANISQAIAGKISGVITSQTSGAPGSDDMKIYIRGRASFAGDNQPLILVDGVEREFSQIAPDDIESISTLKDASATAVYGVRGANGVMLITTKRGKEQKPTVSLTANWQIQSPTRQNTYLDSYNSVVLLEEALANDGLPSQYSASDIEMYKRASAGQLSGIDALLYPNVDWYDTVLRNSAPAQRYNVNIQGGTKRMRYFTSAEYYNQQGLFKEFSQDEYGNKSNSSFKRFAFRANLDFLMTKDLTLSVNFGTRFEERRGPNSNESRDGTYSQAFYEMNHTPGWLFPVSYTVGEGEDQKTLYSGSSQYQNNIVARFAKAGFYRSTNTINETNFIVDYKMDWLTKGLAAKGMVSFDYDAYYMRAFNADFATYELNDRTNYNSIDAYTQFNTDTELAYLGNNQTTTYKLYMEFQLNWARKFGKHDITAMALYNQNDYRYQADLAERYQGLVGRATYGYDDRYLAEVNFGYNGSENFMRGRRFGFFPSFSAGWRISEEAFMKNTKSFLSNLKLRASWGSIGNQIILKPDNTPENYPYIPSMSPYLTEWLVDGQKTTTLNAPAMVSSSFSWEKVYTLDFGVDFGFFDNRFNGTFDWYRRDTKGMLAPGMDLPWVVGATAAKQNAADLKTYGWELELNWRDRINKDWSYRIGFNLYDSQSEITKYNNETNLLGDKIYRKGMKMGEIWGYVTDRFYTEDDFNADGTLKPGIPIPKGAGKVFPGDVLYKNFDDDTETIWSGEGTADNPGDQRIIGNSTPRFHYGITAGISWKGLDLSIFLRGVGKRDYWRTDQIAWPTGGWGSLFKETLDFWTPTNTNAYYPRVYSNDGVNTSYNHWKQSKYLANASYLKLQNITLSYTLPKVWSQRLYFDDVKVFFSGENLYTWDHLPEGLETDMLSKGAWEYPFMRKFSFGINVTF